MRYILFGLFFLVLAGTTSAVEFESVNFPSFDVDITKSAPTRLTAFLAKPVGNGPFPVVIALHGCNGLFSDRKKLKELYVDWAERLVGAGYAVLFPDSFGPRGVSDLCRQAQSILPGIHRLRDVFGSASWLSKQTFVNPERIGLLGWSNGGSTVLWTIDESTGGQLSKGMPRFRVAIALYPGCHATSEFRSWKTNVPTTILIGESDDWVSAKECRALVSRSAADGQPTEIFVYPGAYHGFDAPRQPLIILRNIATTKSGTATYGTDTAARKDAIDKVLTRLSLHLQK